MVIKLILFFSDERLGDGCVEIFTALILIGFRLLKFSQPRPWLVYWS